MEKIDINSDAPFDKEFDSIISNLEEEISILEYDIAEKTHRMLNCESSAVPLFYKEYGVKAKLGSIMYEFFLSYLGSSGLISIVCSLFGINLRVFIFEYLLFVIIFSIVGVIIFECAEIPGCKKQARVYKKQIDDLEKELRTLRIAKLSSQK
jgi:hypothetical protein